MAKKKVMLFIVEGPTDEASLSTVLNRIFSSSTVKFQVVHGDILTRDFTSADKIVAAVWEQVKEFMGSIYRKSDICRIVHLPDMDGVHIVCVRPEGGRFFHGQIYRSACGSAIIRL